MLYDEYIKKQKNERHEFIYIKMCNYNPIWTCVVCLEKNSLSIFIKLYIPIV